LKFTYHDCISLESLYIDDEDTLLLHRSRVQSGAKVKYVQLFKNIWTTRNQFRKLKTFLLHEF